MLDLKRGKNISTFVTNPNKCSSNCYKNYTYSLYL